MILDELNELLNLCKKKFIPTIGKEKGKVLLNLVLEHKPKKILELGSASGYSAIILASEGANVTTVDFDHVSVDEANENFKKYNVDAKALLVESAERFAIELSRKKDEEDTYDLIFLDFAKKKYHEVFPFCLALLKKGGVLAADNVKSVYCMDFKRDILNNRRLRTQIVNVENDEMSISKKL